MAFPSSSGSRQDNLAQAWARARDVAAGIKVRAQALRTQAAAGDVSAGTILDFATAMADAKLMLVRSAAVQGIGPYAQAQVADNTLNVADEFTAMIAALDATVAWIVTNFPKDGNSFLLARTFAPGGTGRTQDRQFASAATVGLRAALDSLIAAID